VGAFGTQEITRACSTISIFIFCHPSGAAPALKAGRLSPRFGKNRRLANVSGLWDTVGMKKTAHPRNHEDRNVERLLERIARKKSAKKSDEDVNEPAARTVREATEES
jgi:hypothetical protein